jgi:dihydroorotate dehydrogenase electron transfer subunit
LLVKNIPSEKEIISLVGGRSEKQIITQGLINVSVATEDGSAGYKGTVLELLREKINKNEIKNFKIFACGPNPMLKALQKLCNENNYDCEISVESAMACGFGICQGCPIEPANGESYLLICKDGPVFNSKAVKL